MGFLQGKKILITGIVSNRSIAYGIAKCCHREGAELAFSYANERFKDRVAGFAADFGSDFVLQMDVSSDEQIDNAFAQIKERWGALDGLVHSIGFAPREAIAGDFLEGQQQSLLALVDAVNAAQGQKSQDAHDAKADDELRFACFHGGGKPLLVVACPIPSEGTGGQLGCS